MTQLLTGKKAIVTGSSRGIGRAIALEFAGQGADVIVNFSRDEAGAQAVAAEIEAVGRRALIVKASVTDKQSVRELFEKAGEAFGTIDILVNNAGRVRDGMLMLMSEQSWDEVIDTNLKGVFLCCKEAVRMMVKQRRGNIINISSLSGVTGRPGQCNYAASKGGVIALTKSLAQEVGGLGIRVNAVAPGIIESEMTESLPDDFITNGRIPLKRAGAPEEIATAAAFLASDMSSYMTGTVLHVNGGLYM